VSSLIKEDKWSQFGHYLVGNDPVPLYHPILALEANRNNRGQVKFIFHDEVYAAANPKLEPTSSLLELYVERVRQLRAKYDYVVLMYSGGADSNNILKCFEHAGEQLDEIVSFVDSSYRNRDSRISSEVYRVALPEVTEYQKAHPECEYRLLEIRDIQTRLFNDSSFKFDAYQDLTYHMVPFSIMHYYGVNYIDKYRDLHNAGKRVCIIHGVDKVPLKLGQLGQDKKWVFRFNDFSSFFGHKHYFRDLPFYDEFFYWTPDLPQIVIKQAHVISRCLDYFDSTNFQTPYRTEQAQNILVRKSGERTSWEYINHILYPFWKQWTFSEGKHTGSRIVNTRDDTLAHSLDDVMKKYKNGIFKTLVLAKQTGQVETPKDQLMTSTDDKTLIGLKSIRTIDHYIE